MDTLQCLSLFFGKHTQAEVSVLVGFEGGRYDEVLSRRQFEACAYLSQVNESLRASFLCVCQEEILIQVHVPLTVKLMEKLTDQRACHTWTSFNSPFEVEHLPVKVTVKTQKEYIRIKIFVKLS